MKQKEKDELFQEFKNRLIEPVKININLIDERVELPKCANSYDACMDIRSNEDIVIKPGETKIIKTGIRVSIPEGYEIQIRNRSGISAKTRMRVANSPGTIDSGYKGEVGIIFTNTSINFADDIYTMDEKENREGSYLIKKNDRIAQMALIKHETIYFKLVDDITFDNDGVNRNGGFGSSGIN